MAINTRVRNLALAALLAAGVAGVSVAQVSAKPKPPGDNGVRCALYNMKTGEWLFFMPGQTSGATDANGHFVVLLCGKDGNWSVALTEAPPASGGPAGGGIDPTP